MVKKAIFRKKYLQTNVMQNKHKKAQQQNFDNTKFYIIPHKSVLYIHIFPIKFTKHLMEH